jgi:hypothetical protein
MRLTWRPLTCAILSTFFVLLLTACGQTGSTPALIGGVDAATVSIALTGPSNVTLGTSSQYAATVTGSSNTGVTWSVNGVTGGSAAVGSISENGLYTAPVTAPQSSKVTIAATSMASPSVAQSLPVALAAPPQSSGSGGSGSTVTLVLNGAASVTLGTSSQYVATVTGSTNTGVTWSVEGVAGGNPTVGSISANGTYTAPANAPQSSNVTITATSLADSSVSKSLAVTLSAPQTRGGNGGGPAVALALSGPTSVTLGASSQYAAKVTGTSNVAVTWSVNGIVGGTTKVGSISTKGLYKAPSTAPQSSNITITATSAADPSIAQSLAVALKAPPPPPAIIALVLSGATKVTLGASSQYAATVTGSTNTGVSWSVNGVTGGNTSVGSISTTGRYIAPAQAPGALKVTITAASKADPSVVQNLAVALVVPPPPPPTVTLAVTGATSVTLGTSSQYAATVTGTSDIAVTWSVNGVVGGDVTVGLISTKGRYTAPATAPQSSKITIAATSLADPAVSQSLSVALAAPTPPSGGTVTLTLGGATSVTLGTSSQYAATVKGSTNTAVTWSVDGVTGGDASIGSISTKGLYTAPAKAPAASKVTITATSAADTSVAQSLAVALDAPPPAITLVLSGATKVTLGTSSQYAATVTGSTNTGVTWSVNGVAGGNATDGSISAQGLYAAPATAPQPSTVTIAATSMADPSIAKSLVTTLVAPVSPSGRIPSNAISSGDLNASTRWVWNHDPGTPGSSQGSSVYPSRGVSSDNAAREFYMTYSGHGGEIYHVSFATDKNATHFVYDAYVYVANPSQLANLEMDMNDVMADGRTVILGTQCSTYSKSWEYTYYSGGSFHWRASNIPCDPKTWSANTWHHIQIASHRDSNGIATYDWVNFDEQYTDFKNATGNSASSLGWALGDLLINFQIDGANSGSGSNTLYTDKLIVYRW